MTEKTHFGYSQIDKEEKERRVGEVFHSVAEKYDLMNDVMSLGVHRFWKYFTILSSDVKKGMSILDLASGTCDLAIKMGKKLDGTGQIVASDINESMLSLGKDRLTNAGLVENVECVIANAEQLPFADRQFDLVTMAFGLRNVTDKDQALREIFRVLKTGGKLLVLEFSKPDNRILESLYDFYSFSFLPKMGQLVANDAASYQYLAESIRMHPDQERLKAMFEEAGFKITRYQNLSGGIVALHQGIKI